MKVLLIDNYDSFTYNIVELLRQIEIRDLTVAMNDKISIPDAHGYDKIIISPGPSLPFQSGQIINMIRALSPTHPILGICLGHQAIAEVFGAGLMNLPQPFHGYKTRIDIVSESGLFKGVPPAFYAGLYHSWVVDEKNFPECLQVSSKSKEQHIMSLNHKHYRVHGVQFHPESYMTEYGKQVFENFLSL